VRLTGGTLTFSFTGLVLASVIYSFPFAVQPLQAAFEAVGRKPLEAAATLGAAPLDAFLRVASPLAVRGYVSAIVLSFAHTLGEFGVVLMVGGNIPGRTEVISIAVYEHVEKIEYAQAHVLAAGLLVFSFAVLLGVYGLNRRMPLVRT
jgi:molybdate transport system permease protein